MNNRAKPCDHKRAKAYATTVEMGGRVTLIHFRCEGCGLYFAREKRAAHG